MTLKELSENWNKYIKDFYPSAFWFLNDEMTKESMEDILLRMSENKIREVLFHPSHGLSVPFLSDEFFEKIRYALSLAGQNNIKVWIYDDYGWPTGVLGGKFLEAYPEFVMKFLGLCDGIPKVMTCKRLHDGNMGAPWCKNTLGYIDTLSKQAMKKFIEMNYERYKKETGDLWKNIKGFFTDEPAIMMAYEYEDFSHCSAFPWTVELPGEFIKQKNYDIEPYYKELFLPGYSKYKEDYWEVAINLHTEAYFKQLGNWCKKEGKEWTGHVREDSFRDQVRFGGNIYKSLSQMTYPGVDFLNSNSAEEHYETEIVSSVKKAMGKKKVYMEAFGISPYSLTPQDMYHKIQLFACERVNDLALMGWENSSKGIRKRAYWSPMHKDAPWFDYYPHFRDSVARVMALSNLGEDKRHIAVLYPQAEIEMCVGDLDTPGDKCEEIESKFKSLIDKIYNLGYEFDWVFPEMLSEVSVQENKIVFPYEKYSLFIVLKDFYYSEETKNILNFLSKNTDNLIWKNLCDIEIMHNPETNFIICDFSHRIYTYEYEDGYLYSVRNTGSKKGQVIVNTDKNISLWCGDKNRVYFSKNKIEVLPKTSIYFSLTDNKICAVDKNTTQGKDINIPFGVRAIGSNTAPLSNVCAFHKEKGWINLSRGKMGDFYNPKDLPRTDCLPILSLDFMGCTRIPCKANFWVKEKTKLGLLFEKDYFSSLVLNGEPVNLDNFCEEFFWDRTNRVVDLSSKICEGENNISFTLNFKKYETTFKNNGFFSFGPMPSVDVALVGDFLYKDNKISAYSNEKNSLPLNLADFGFANTYGKVCMFGEFVKRAEMNNISLDIIGSPVCELFIDNVSIGVNLTDYIFDIKDVSEGKHEISFVITGTSASLFDCKENNVFIINRIYY